MTKKEFIDRVTNSHKDFLAEFVDILKDARIPFCLIGGLAVNAYAEPVVSLDMDVVVVAGKVEDLVTELNKRKYKITRYANSINVSSTDSDIRIQLQIDPRYQPFIKLAQVRDVLGYRLPVARIEDVFKGKAWAAEDTRRRPSKRQKDLSDIQRLIETKPALIKQLSEPLKKQLVR